MTVRELIEALSVLNPDLEVRIEDTYTRNEGWTPEHDFATCPIEHVIVRGDGFVELAEGYTD